MKKCSKCGTEKELSNFGKLYEGLRPSCKECDRKARDPYKVKLDIMTNSLIQRLSNTQNKRNACYKDVENRLGSTRVEIKNFIHENFENDIKEVMKSGESPSLDRIDSSGHYEKGNVRVISFRENSLRGLEKAVEVTSKKVMAVFPNGEEQLFNSISDASRQLGLKRGTIIDKLKNGTEITSYRTTGKGLRGVKFKY